MKLSTPHCPKVQCLLNTYSALGALWEAKDGQGLEGGYTKRLDPGLCSST